VWAAGLLGLLAYLAAGHVLARRLCGRARTAPAAQHKLLLRCAAEFGIRRRVRLLLTPDVTVPLTCGWLRPAIVLPEHGVAWPEPRLRRVLMHELAHVARGDCLSMGLARAACAIFWFHPGVWAAARAMRADAEMACDAAVVRADGAPVAYAEDLLGIASAVRPRPLAAATVPMARPSGLERRIRTLLEDRGRRGGASEHTLFSVLGLAALLGAASALRLSDAVAVSPDPRDWLVPASVPGDREGWMVDCGAVGDALCPDGARRALDMLEQSGRTGAVAIQRVSSGELIAYAALRPAGAGREAAVPLSSPGSVAKLALAALWWEEGIDHHISCPSRRVLSSGRSVRNAGDFAQDPISVEGMLVGSCNTAAAEMGEILVSRLGAERLSEEWARVGFGSRRTGQSRPIDNRLWASTEAWAGLPEPYLDADGDLEGSDALVLAGIGLGGGATTPLHVSRFLQAVGNRGILVEPRPASTRGRGAESRRLLSEPVAAALREAMLRTVREGTAARTVPQLEWSNWSLGGKTGTVPRSDGASDGWFAGLAHGPDGEPEYTVVVLLEGGGMGGRMPAGIAAEMTRLFARVRGDEL
jgi:hypothetical protein